MIPSASSRVLEVSGWIENSAQSSDMGQSNLTVDKSCCIICVAYYFNGPCKSSNKRLLGTTTTSCLHEKDSSSENHEQKPKYKPIIQWGNVTSGAELQVEGRRELGLSDKDQRFFIPLLNFDMPYNFRERSNKTNLVIIQLPLQFWSFTVELQFSTWCCVLFWVSVSCWPPQWDR